MDEAVFLAELEKSIATREQVAEEFDRQRQDLLAKAKANRDELNALLVARTNHLRKNNGARQTNSAQVLKVSAVAEGKAASLNVS